jgi:pimeloyl-ACP methyl ester carboxylesterase
MMLDLISADVLANEVKIHYYRTGGEKPPLVLLHGFTDDGLCWTPVAEVLSAAFDVVMVDARGHGKSEASANGYTLENLATDSAALIKALGLNKPFLLGHSIGAVTALVLAGLFPDLPGAIVMEDPPAFWALNSSTRNRSEHVTLMIEQMEANKRKTRDELLAEGRANNPSWSEAELDPWVNAKHRYSLKITGLLSPPDIIAINFPKLFEQITCPALLLSADSERGAAAGEGDLVQLKALLPHLQIVHITGAGHNIRRERFERYIEVVQGFLADIQ